MGFNQAVCWVRGPTALFFVPTVGTVCTSIQLGTILYYAEAE